MNTTSIDPQILNIFGQLLNQTHDIFVVCDAGWNIIFANRKACQYFSDGQELAGKNLVQEFPVYKNSRLLECMNNARDAGKSTEFEELSPFSKRWMYFRLYPTAGLLAVYATDVNLRKEAQRTIHQNQERYFNFISQSTEGIWRYEVEEPISIELPPDEQIDLMYQHAYLAECNDAMAKMYGFRDAYDLMGSRLEMLLPKHEENLAYLRAFVESGYRLTDAESKEVAKDGSVKYMLNNLIGIVENGRVARAWGTQRDITPIKEVEAKMKDAQDQMNLALTAGCASVFNWGDGDWEREVHPEDLAAVRQAIDNAGLDMEFRTITPDGSVHWVLAKGKVVGDRVIGVTIDITNRKSF